MKRSFISESYEIDLEYRRGITREGLVKYGYLDALQALLRYLHFENSLPPKTLTTEVREKGFDLQVFLHAEFEEP